MVVADFDSLSACRHKSATHICGSTPDLAKLAKRKGAIMAPELLTILAVVGLCVLLLLIVRLRAFRALFRFIGRLFRPLRRLMRRPGAKLPHYSQPIVGPSSWAPLIRAVREETDTDAALGEDAAGIAKNLQTKSSLGFQAVSHTSDFIGLNERFDDDILKRFAARANEFFASKVPIDANSNSLYEDCEGAVIARTWKTPELKLFVVLDRFRKVINYNVMWMSTLFSGLIILDVCLIMLFAQHPFFDLSKLINFDSLGALYTMVGQKDFTNADINLDLFALIVAGLSILNMAWIYFTNFRPTQMANFQEMRAFLSNYFAQMQTQFNTLHGRLLNTANSQEQDEVKVKRDFALLGETYVWSTMRPYFAESFLRSVLYQIRRNSGLYVVFMPVLFFLLALGILSIANQFAFYSAHVKTFIESGHFIVPVVALIAFYVQFLVNSLHSIKEIDQNAYVGFDNWGLDERIRNIFEAYGERIAGFNRRRMG